MVFNSYTFIVFFVVVIAIYYLPLSWQIKKWHLLISSYVFYAAWNPPFVLLLIFSTFIDFYIGKSLSITNDALKRKLLLSLSLIGNLGPLCYFKYGGFLLENFQNVINAFGVNFHAAAPDIILPIGISFYTFQTMCYSLDMYHRKYEAEKSFGDFALFVTFFPQLVAGPIVRPDELIPQFKQETRAKANSFFEGLFLLTLGLFMKVVLADSMLASSADSVFDSKKSLAFLDAWTGVLAFSGQIFFDFGGYSTCAIGIAMCLGFHIRDNFLYPYAAIGFSDFWKRWHITLSSWLRDYLYIPLGGNRMGNIRTYINLMLTMLIGGLWHGANWTFVVWGGLHGTYLAIEKWIKDKTNIKVFRNQYNWILALFTFICVNITWVFFRAQDFKSAASLLKSMFGLQLNAEPLLDYTSISKVFIIMIATLIIHWKMRDRKVLDTARQISTWKVVCVWTGMLILLVLSQESTSSFIYFQF